MSRTPNAAFDLNGFLPYQLDAIASRVSEALLGLYGERHDLRMPDWRVLVWLDHAPELAAKDIAVRARMDKATVSRALTRLESRDLVTRATAEDDQRSQSLQLTRKGKALLGKLLPQVQKWEASLLASFSATEQRQLRELLGRLEGQLDGSAGSAPARKASSPSVNRTPTSKSAGRSVRPAARTAAKTAAKPARAKASSSRTGRSAPAASKTARATQAKKRPGRSGR